MREIFSVHIPLFLQKQETTILFRDDGFAFPLKMGEGAIIKTRLFAAGQSSIFSISDVRESLLIIYAA